MGAIFDQVPPTSGYAALHGGTRFGAARVVPLLLGTAVVAWGSGLLVRVNFDAGDVLQHGSLLGLHGSTLLAVLLIAYGAGLITVGAFATVERFGLVFLSVVAIGLGVVFMIDSAPFHHALGVHALHGVLLVLIGLAELAATVFETRTSTHTPFRT